MPTMSAYEAVAPCCEAVLDAVLEVESKANGNEGRGGYHKSLSPCFCVWGMARELYDYLPKYVHISMIIFCPTIAQQLLKGG